MVAGPSAPSAAAVSVSACDLEEAMFDEVLSVLCSFLFSLPPSDAEKSFPGEYIRSTYLHIRSVGDD